VLHPPPIVIAIEAPHPAAASDHGWRPYVDPAATIAREDLPFAIGWSTEPPFGISPDAAARALDLASRAWAIPGCSVARFQIVEHAPSTSIRANGRSEIVVHTDDWPPPLSGGAAAHTIVFTSGSRIVEADVHLDARRFRFVVGSAPPAIDLQAILTHELGHVLGIGHSEVARATMAAGLPPGIAARSLEDDDVTAVCALYPSPEPQAPSDGCTAAGCPSGTVCVGFECLVEGEPSTAAGPCLDREGHRCEGAGDRARCLATTAGELCAPPCAAGACGVARTCVVVDDVGRCLPDGVSAVDHANANDAGEDATLDAGDRFDAVEGRGCAVSPTHRAGRLGALLAVAIALLRTFRDAAIRARLSGRWPASTTSRSSSSGSRSCSRRRGCSASSRGGSVDQRSPVSSPQE
jgi:hypothetical protein